MALKNYVLGRGKILLAPFAAGTKTPDGYRYVGNSPGFTLNSESDTIEHYSSDEGIREKDASAELQVNRTGTMTLDDIQKENLALFLFGSSSILSQASATGEQDTITVDQGKWYQLGEGTEASQGVRSVSNVVVSDAGGMGSTYTVDTDYIVHADIGMIEIVAGGGISDATEVDIDYDIAAVDRDLIVSGNTPFEGAMKYIEFNPVGENKVVLLPYVKIRPNGDFNLKSDEWQSMQFAIEAIKTTLSPAVSINGAPV